VVVAAVSAGDRIADRLHGSIMAATDDLPDDLHVGVAAALADLPVVEVVAWLVERGALRLVPDLWVYDGPERHVEGVPFGHTMRPGDGYRGDGLEPCRPVYVLEPPSSPPPERQTLLGRMWDAQGRPTGRRGDG
jgi:hypothetical protein